jgi:hypothetical protein
MDRGYYERILEEWEPSMAAQLFAKKCMAYESQMDVFQGRIIALEEIIRRIKSRNEKGEEKADG